MSKMPNQKFGVVRMNRNTTRIVWSIQRPLLTAASRPKVSVKTPASPIAYTVSPMVIGIRLKTISLTGWRNINELPHWPRTRPETNSQYCSGSGLLRPSWSRSSAMFCTVPRSPRSMAAGSPGRKCTMPKTRMVTPKRTKTIRNRRLRMYVARPISAGTLRGQRGPPGGKGLKPPLSNPYLLRVTSSKR